jgi:hypothetical protein
MMPPGSLWQDLERKGFTAAHLKLLHTLLMSGKNGSWAVHVHGGRIGQVDLRLLSPSHPAEMSRLDTMLVELQDGNPA